MGSTKAVNRSGRVLRFPGRCWEGVWRNPSVRPCVPLGSAGSNNQTCFEEVMKGLVRLLVVGLAVALTAPAFAQETAAPATKADCEKAKGTWDDATSKCTMKK